MSVEQHKIIIHRYVEEVLNGGNLAVADELMVPNYVYHDPIGPDIHNLDGFKQLIASFQTVYPDLYFTVQDMIFADDKAVLRWTFHGTQKGEFRGVAPSGKQIVFTGISIFHFANNKITEEWVNSDALGYLQQIGMIAFVQ